MRWNTLIIDTAAALMAVERTLAMLAPDLRERLANRLLAGRRSRWQKLLGYAASHPNLTAKLGTYAFTGGVLLATALNGRAKRDAVPKVAS